MGDDGEYRVRGLEYSGSGCQLMSTENSYTRTQLTWTLQDDMTHPRIYAYTSHWHAHESTCTSMHTPG